jgi:hypothetical protein
MLKHVALFIFVLLGFSFNANAQFGFSHEVGVIAGPVAFQSDWAAVYLNTNAGNTGLGIGIIHYINFPMKQNATVIPDTYFNDHFKLRSELSYNKTDLEHFGEWVAEAY